MFTYNMKCKTCRYSRVDKFDRPCNICFDNKYRDRTKPGRLNYKEDIAIHIDCPHCGGHLIILGE